MDSLCVVPAPICYLSNKDLYVFFILKILVLPLISGNILQNKDVQKNEYKNQSQKFKKKKPNKLTQNKLTDIK
jgi:hypothetical protein